MPRIYVTPRVAVFRDPVSQEPLPKEGAWKDDSFDWRRAAIQGDVDISETGPDQPGDSSKPKKSGG